MDRGKKAALVVLGIVLFVVLLSANVTVALERTAFDADYAKETAEEVELYESLAEELRNQVTTGTTGTETPLPFDRSMDQLLAAAITDEYVQSQGENNIENVYAYLNGRTDDLQIGFETEPLEENLVDEVETELEDLNLTEIPMPYAEQIEAMTESRDAFQERRASFRKTQKQRIQEGTQRELSDEELDRRLNASMDQIRDELTQEVEGELEGQFEGPEAALVPPIRDLQTARIDALTGELTYEEYIAEVDAAKADLSDAFVTIFEQNTGDQLPEEIDVTDQLTQQQLETLETARTIVSLSRPVAVGLSLLAVMIAGAVAWLSPREIASIEVGTVSALVGVVGIVGSRVSSAQIHSQIGTDGGAIGIQAFVVELVVGIFDALIWQSVLLLLVGAGLIAISIAVRKEYIEL